MKIRNVTIGLVIGLLMSAFFSWNSVLAQSSADGFTEFGRIMSDIRKNDLSALRQLEKPATDARIRAMRAQAELAGLNAAQAQKSPPINYISAADAQIEAKDNMKETLFSTAVPAQKDELLNKLASKNWIVYRNPGSALTPFLPSEFQPNPERDFRDIDHVWKFGFGTDANGNKRVVLGVDVVSHRSLSYTFHNDPFVRSRPEVSIDFNSQLLELSNKERFEQTYDKFEIAFIFSLANFTVEKLLNERTIDQHRFPPGTTYVLFQGEDIDEQKQNAIGGDASDHLWTLRLFPQDNGTWIGHLTDKFTRRDELKEIANLRDFAHRNNREHIVLLVPMQKNVGVTGQSASQQDEKW